MNILDTLRRAVFLVALTMVACGPEYERTEISAVKGSDIGGAMDIQHLEVPEGMIVKAHLVVWNDDNEPMELAVRSTDPSVVEIAGIINDRDYAFIGLKTGHAEIEFIADETRVLTISADVSPQKSLP